MLPVAIAACSPSAPETSRTCESVAASKEWSTERSYGLGVVPRGDHIQIGVTGSRSASVTGTVRTPDGQELTSTSLEQQSRGDGRTHYVARYPRDFARAGQTGAVGAAAPGTYSVRWTVNGALVACDTFTVSRAALADAEPCAPPGWSATAPFGSTSLTIRNGTARMSISGDQATLGVAGDPWYVFEEHERHSLALPDGTTTTLYVSRSERPRRVEARFRAADIHYRFSATAESVPDLVSLSREVITCAQQRLTGR